MNEEVRRLADADERPPAVISDYRQLLELARKTLSMPDRRRLATMLLDPDLDRMRQRDKLYRQIRATWYGALKGKPAAVKFAADARHYHDGEYAAGHRHAMTTPESLRGTLRGDFWKLFRFGPPLSAERLRQIFRSGDDDILASPAKSTMNDSSA